MSSEQPDETALDLRAIRQSRGLTLKDVSSSTRISPQNLKAIEEQRFDLLPEPIYARAFIDMYAGVLDVDGTKILLLYEQYLKDLEPDEDRYEVLKKLAAKRRHLEIWLWVVIVVGLIALIGSFYLYRWSTGDRQVAEEVTLAGQVEVAGEDQAASGEDSPDEPAAVDVAGEGKEALPKIEGAPPPAPPAADRPHDAAQTVEDLPPPVETGQTVTLGERPAAEASQPEETSVPPADERPYVLAIEASELTWIEITRDGETPFEVMLWPGERITERASERFALLIGNAGGVEIRFQGQSLGPLGEHGQVIRLTLPAAE